ncbi:Tyrosine-protein phosphatase non-receptor type 12, partial [Dissostichus eleginoides]
MEQQAWILRSFLSQLQRQEAADGIAGEFTRLKSQSMKYRSDRTFPTKTAEKQENSKKNRYKDIVPFDYTRVKLTLSSSKNDNEYINASFIKGVSGSRAYIATQGPLPHTVLDFLRMLWEYDIKVVVMACQEFEMGKKKCERYWPEEQDQQFVCEPFTVYCDSEDIKGDYLTRTLRVTYGNCSRTVQQLQYFNWPDHGVPDSVPPILDMLQEMRSYQEHDDVPFCIHCSAGCGRTGVLCVIDYTWRLLKKQMIPSMRTQRPSVVQTKEQYELVYRTIRLLFERFLQEEQSVGEVRGRKHSLRFKIDKALHQQSVRQIARVSPSAPPDTESSLSDLSDEEEQLHQYQLLQQEEEHSHSLPTPAGNYITQKATVLQEGVRLMVEDPYFDTPRSSTSSEDPKWTASPLFSPPALHLHDQELNSPVAVTPGPDRDDEEEAPPLPQRTPESFEMAAGPGRSPAEKQGNPPSPVPPLPERTPESFELALDEEQTLDQEQEYESQDDLHRTPESFILPTEPVQEPPCPQQTPPLPQQTPPCPPPQVGRSSEWDGTSQPKRFLEVVLSRSKSVRAKSSRQEPLSVFQQPAPPGCNRKCGGGSSLKFFRHKLKPKTAPPPPPSQPETPAANGASTLGFKLGFGYRFGKPKGPRSHPETWEVPFPALMHFVLQRGGFNNSCTKDLNVHWLDSSLGLWFWTSLLGPGVLGEKDRFLPQDSGGLSQPVYDCAVSTTAQTNPPTSCHTTGEIQPDTTNQLINATETHLLLRVFTGVPLWYTMLRWGSFASL